MPIPSSTASRTRSSLDSRNIRVSGDKAPTKLVLRSSCNAASTTAGAGSPSALRTRSNTRGVNPSSAPRTTAARTSDAECSNSRLSERNTSCAGTFPTASAASVTTTGFVIEKFGSANLRSARNAGRVKTVVSEFSAINRASTAIGSPSSSHSIRSSRQMSL